MFWAFYIAGGAGGGCCIIKLLHQEIQILNLISLVKIAFPAFAVEVKFCISVNAGVFFQMNFL